MNRILVTGATGFIGQKMVSFLLQQGIEVVALCRSAKKAEKLSKIFPEVNTHLGDITDYPSILGAAQSCDRIIHMAALAIVWDRDPRRFYTVNVEGTMNIARASAELGMDRWVFVSTAGTFGPSFTSMVNEDTFPSQPYFTHYESSKSVAEKYIQDQVIKGMDVVTVHPTRVYGPGLLSESNGVTRMVQLYLRGKFRFYPGDGNAIGNYVFVDDVVEGIYFSLLKGKTGERYLLGGENVSYREFFRTVKNLTDVHYKMRGMPLSMLKGMARGMILGARAFGSTPLISPGLVNKYYHNWAVDSGKAVQNLGYKITCLETGLKETIASLRSE